MRSCDEVIECFLVSGQSDYVMRIACESLDHYRDLTNAWTDDATLGIERISSPVATVHHTAALGLLTPHSEGRETSALFWRASGACDRCLTTSRTDC